ncbi:peptide chain release factor N(5)-glutamine methyltransferase [Leptotrichia sp. oral taxon 847]|uniref:peptide chain release factor N(5)-glutamine methyltransferase n=1 Tax=Leptotrichia sp. oral taxon 847 TaxID=1785996 RepID=UPI000767E349|nr:peptide chain release factor N(5)-glutamine methyltransferase [Leptotrichia sp. oral taxon 847]AMD94655.1 modification methylase HemK [Leptotrichia sp. oral taxon 847]
MNNLLTILNKSIEYLERKQIKHARLKVESIFSEILKMPRIMLYANFESVLLNEEIDEIKKKLSELLKKNKNFFYVFDSQNGDNLKNLLDKSISFLEKNNVNEAKLKAEIIFSSVLGIERMMLFTRYGDKVSEENKNKLRNFIVKIGKENFPIQYLLNEQEFYGRKFYVDKGVLIPRQDTEVLVQKAIEILKKNENKNKISKKILDIGCGSGIIGITIALEIENCYVLGVDVSEKALMTSKKNKKILESKNIKFIRSDLFENVEFKSFDMIVSNPPYISLSEVGIMSDDTLHEPSEALFAENDGLYFYLEISSKAKDYLAENGFLLFEIGFKQGHKVKEIMEKFGFKNIEIVKDLNGNERVVIGQKIS